MRWVPALALAGALAVCASASPHSLPVNAGIVWGADGVYGADADGSDVHKVTEYFPWPRRSGGPDGYTSPAWSRTGRSLAYHIWGSGTHDIIVVRPGMPEGRSLLGSWEAAGDPTWSPDERRVAFAGGSWSGWSGIWSVDVQSRRVRQITPAKRGRSDRSPSWSPDGRTIAFTREVIAQPPVVYLVGANGGRTRWLTRGASPSWSPRGDRLVFAWGTGIYRIDADGTDRTRLAHVSGTRGALLDPHWSPDGRQILYARNPYGDHPTIWVMNADGTGRRRIVSLQGPNLLGIGWRPG